MEPSTERSPSAAHSAAPIPNSAISPSDALDELLSYPAPSELAVPLPSSSSSTAQPRTILKDRLYVGNLHPTVDEYTLLQLFSKFGRISKLDYLFHKSGPLKGKPRGYAFVEYANRDDAEKALTHANDKLLRGRKLVVTYANQAPIDAAGMQGLGARSRRPVSDVGKPTTLSMLKSAGAGRSDATDAKIARMEAKLRQLESTPAGSAAGASSSHHPSLPPKPVATNITPTSRYAPARTPSARAPPRGNARTRNLPVLPLPPKSAVQPSRDSAAAPLATLPTSTTSPPPPRAPPTRKAALAGVRLVKSKPQGTGP
ncbi:hypothetical protein C2E23DRAFT_736989 [Lenzites betulinus]|nr:hypothetical protein C2E23DRAFT_736989 [Lenzites betulinus]